MPRSRVLWIGAAAALVFVLLVTVDGSRSVEIRINDPIYVVRGARVAVDCLGHGRFRDCHSNATPPVETVGAWPLSPYLVAIPLAAAGVDEIGSLTVLTCLSRLGVVGLL